MIAWFWLLLAFAIGMAVEAFIIGYGGEI